MNEHTFWRVNASSRALFHVVLKRARWEDGWGKLWEGFLVNGCPQSGVPGGFLLAFLMEGPGLFVVKLVRGTFEG